MRLAYVKWFFRDYENEELLWECSDATRAVWPYMLAAMSKADPYGFFVSPTGETIDIAHFAARFKFSLKTVRTALREVVEKKVASVDSQGRIFSRRLIADHTKLLGAQENGLSGGNPRLARGTVPKEQRVRPFRRTDSPAKTERIFNRTAGCCYWCGVPLQREHAGRDFFHVDHVIAVRDGGSNDEENLVASCAKCNHDRALDPTLLSDDPFRLTVGEASDTNPDTNPDPNADANPDTNPSRAPISEAQKLRSSDSLRSSALGFENWPTDVAELRRLALIFLAAFGNCRDPVKAEKHVPAYTELLAVMRSRGTTIKAAWAACADARLAHNDKPLFGASIKAALAFLPAHKPSKPRDGGALLPTIPRKEYGRK